MSEASGARRVPHHALVASTLRARIDDRQLPPGSSLPSEKALCGAFGVSRSVIRQALATLENEGLISKSQGRGTIVSARGGRRPEPARSAGLSAQLLGLGARTTTRVLTHRVERLRCVDDEPVAVIRTWLPAELATVLPASALENASLHEQLAELAGLTIASGSREVRATAARPPVDELLAVEEGFPLLLLEGESFDATGRVIEVFSTWHRSDRVAFDVSVGPAVQAAPPTERLFRLKQLLAELSHEIVALETPATR